MIMNDPVYVLGINENHDSSAVLCKNGMIVSGVAQERVSRKKHDGHAIRQAIEYVLSAEGIAAEDLSAIVSCVHGAEKCDETAGEREYKAYLDKSVPFYYHPSHHSLHAFSVFLTSPFNESAIMVCDGLGSEFRFIYGTPEEPRKIDNPGTTSRFLEHRYYEGESFYLAQGKNIANLWKKLSTHFPYQFDKEDISLGRLYSYASKHVFESRYDAGKLMALACLGQQDNITRASFLKIQGEKISVDSSRLEAFATKSFMDRNPLKHLSLAANVQKDIEDALLLYADRLYKQSEQKNLCFSGGVALNCQANTRLLEESNFDNLYIMPASTDDGIAVGAALYGYHHLLGNPRTPLQYFNPYLGKKYPLSSINNAVNRSRLGEKIDIEHYHNDFSALCLSVAKMLNEGKIVCWYQDGSEFGPRALGNRSILASPRTSGIKDFINRYIKEREEFRPLAPSVLEDECSEIFEVPQDFSSPYMSRIAFVKKRLRDRYSEIVHKDGSARLQTVASHHNPKFYMLIQTFFSLSGIPMLLNTSLNSREEPIIETPEQAISFFRERAVDVLVMDSVVIQRAR